MRLLRNTEKRADSKLKQYTLITNRSLTIRDLSLSRDLGKFSAQDVRSRGPTK